MVNKVVLSLVLFSFATRAGSPQQCEPITAGPYNLTHPVNFPCGGKPEDPEKTRDLRQSVDFYSFHMRSGFDHIEKTPEWRTIFLLQHDMPEKMLQQGLNGPCVSLVGVDLNASGVYALK